MLASHGKNVPLKAGEAVKMGSHDTNRIYLGRNTDLNLELKVRGNSTSKTF